MAPPSDKTPPSRSTEAKNPGEAESPGALPGLGVLRGSGAAGEPQLNAWIAALGRMSAAHPDVGRILRLVDRLQDRPYRTHCVLFGEPGTGKEGLARLLHWLMHAGNQPLVRVQLAGKSDAEIGRELLGGGGDRSALDRAAGGTLVLDEVLALSPELQRRLYERLHKQDWLRDDSVVVIAVTDGDIRSAVAAGEFRHDLFYRLARLCLHVPPLRERPDDLGHSAMWIANRLLRARGIDRPAELFEIGEHTLPPSEGAFHVLPEAIDALRAHDWPGNFRELETVLERAIMLYSDGEQLLAQDIESAIADGEFDRHAQLAATGGPQ